MPTAMLVLSTMDPLGGAVRRLRSHSSTLSALYMTTRSERATNGGPWGGRAVRHRRRVEASTRRQAAKSLVEYQTLVRRSAWLSAGTAYWPGVADCALVFFSRWDSVSEFVAIGTGKCGHSSGSTEHQADRWKSSYAGGTPCVRKRGASHGRQRWRPTTITCGCALKRTLTR